MKPGRLSTRASKPVSLSQLLAGEVRRRLHRGSRPSNRHLLLGNLLLDSLLLDSLLLDGLLVDNGSRR